MGIKARKVERARVHIVHADPFAVDPDDIPDDAPTHCIVCNSELTPLRRTSGRDYCTSQECQDAQTIQRTKQWRMVDLHKQGPTVVIVDGTTPINTSKNGARA